MSSVIDDTRRAGDLGRSRFAHPAAGNLLLAWVATVTVPLAIVFDTWRAVASGWMLRDAGGLALLYWLSLVAVLGACLALLLGSGFRRRLRQHAAPLMRLAAGLLLGVVVAQGLATVFAPAAPFHGRTPRAEYRLHPDPRVLPGVRHAAHLRYDAWGRRYDPSAPVLPAHGDDRQLRIVCLGGSTTECLYLDDTETWPARLGQRLRRRGIDNQTVAVARTGCASGHHARLLEDPRRVDLRRADCLVMLLGADDLTRAVLALSDGRVPGPLWFRSPLARLTRDVWNGYLGHGMLCDSSGQWLTILRRTRGAGPFDRGELEAVVAQRLARYRQTLNELARLVSQRKQRLLLVTQPVLWDARLAPAALRRLWLARQRAHTKRAGGEPRDTPGRFPPSLLREMIDRFNGALKETATTNGLFCVDAATTMSGHEQFFYDDFHLNEAGCDTLAQLVADALANHLALRPASQTASAASHGPSAGSADRRSQARQPPDLDLHHAAASEAVRPILRGEAP